MKKHLLQLSIALLISSIAAYAQQPPPPESNSVVLAYVTSGSAIIPDPDYITHINYAFGHVNETFNGIMINRSPRVGTVNYDGRPSAEERLRSIVALKMQKPSLKILLSIGGWGSGRFSEMAADESNRLAFAADCKRVVDDFGLDGIDLDWEYPTSSASGISSSPNDTENFTLLMRDIRKAIGVDKLLTFASPCNARYVDFKGVIPYLDFVNIMSYDIYIDGSAHHAGLFRSEFTGEYGLSCEESVQRHVIAGVPIHKLTLGIPFYGRGREQLPQSVDYRNIINIDGALGYVDRRNRKVIGVDYEYRWDEAAHAPYWIDSEGKFVFTYETPESIAIKCAWLKQKGMLGAMYWQYAGDDDRGTLRKAVYNGVMGR
jgi:chitinase